MASLLFKFCGLRVAEVANLTIPTIDFGNNRILVLNGKFRKDRVVYMSNDAQQAIKDYLNIRKRYKTKGIFLGQRWLATTLNYHHSTPYASLFPVTG